MKDSDIKVVVCGAMGNMGSRIIRSVLKAEDMMLVGAIDKPGIPVEGKDVGEAIGIETLDVDVRGSDKLTEVLEEVSPDVLVDFSVAEAAVNSVEKASEAGVSVVVGTTGFSEDQRIRMESLVSDSGISAIISSNMAPGVNVFFKLVEEAASNLFDYDMELIEAHHNKKVDSPSGTALTAAKMAAEASGKDFEEVARYGRKRGHIGERERDEIGIHSVRAGNISGDHTFIFAGDNERLEITHRARDRQVFVDGTLKAIRYVSSEEMSGRVLTMKDVLFGE
ncbi:MAG: 4-hydroxy-tetrahydrodipicolinate reductase [Candidatus Hadarchaeota archaeon]